MRTMTDWELIQQFAKSRSEAAFVELVRRHLAWVYSVALRKVRQPQLAEDVTQSVFALLARKAGSLRSGTILGGWLFRTTCFVASRAVRAEQRQKLRQQTASAMTATTILPDDNEAAWEQLAPHLDEAAALLCYERLFPFVFRRTGLRRPGRGHARDMPRIKHWHQENGAKGYSLGPENDLVWPRPTLPGEAEAE